MEFSEWLQAQLSKREWTAYDLAESAKARGYKLESSMVYRIINRETEGGVTTVIAIAHGLRISRKEAFVARGWLLPDTDESDSSVDDPDLLLLMQEVATLPADIRQPLITAAFATLQAVKAGQNPSQVSQPHQGSSNESAAWITVEEAARFVGYTTRTIQKLLQEQKIEGMRRGKQWFTTREAVEQYKATTKVGRPPTHH